MLTVHGSPVSPFVRKTLVVLEEKGVPYDLVPVFPFGPNPEFRRISPLGKIPALTDGEHSLCDSSVIVAFLERIHPEPSLLPSDPWEAGRALWIEEYADTAMVNVIGVKIFFPRIVAPRFMNQPADEVAIGRAIESYPEDIKVVVIGTGGLSHQLEGQRAGFINTAFDRRCMDAMTGDIEGILGIDPHELVELAGSQGVEVMNWVAMRGALTGDVRELHRNYHIPISNTAAATMLLENQEVAQIRAA